MWWAGGGGGGHPSLDGPPACKCKLFFIFFFIFFKYLLNNFTYIKNMFFQLCRYIVSDIVVG